MATRWRWPPESSLGLCIMRVSMPTDASASLARCDALFGRDAGVDQRQLDVVQRGGAGQQVEGLEDESDFFVADARQFVVVQFADQLAVQPVVALAGRIQAADQVHQRGLAGAGRSHDGDVFVALDAQVDSAQRVHLLLRAHVVGLPQVFGADHARFGRRRHYGLRNIDDFCSCHFFLLVLWGHSACSDLRARLSCWTSQLASC